jgi:hypothetical protein
MILDLYYIKNCDIYLAAHTNFQKNERFPWRLTQTSQGNAHIPAKQTAKKCTFFLANQQNSQAKARFPWQL